MGDFFHWQTRTRKRRRRNEWRKEWKCDWLFDDKRLLQCYYSTPRTLVTPNSRSIIPCLVWKPAASTLQRAQDGINFLLVLATAAPLPHPSDDSPENLLSLHFPPERVFAEIIRFHDPRAFACLVVILSCCGWTKTEREREVMIVQVIPYRYSIHSPLTWLQRCIRDKFLSILCVLWRHAHIHAHTYCDFVYDSILSLPLTHISSPAGKTNKILIESMNNNPPHITISIPNQCVFLENHPR